MKRFHVHISVPDLSGSIRFYTTLFGAEPTVVKADYAKWMLEDPRVNFAISQRDRKPGVNHIGLQVESADEFAAMRERLLAADASMLEQKATACCYARSDKYWVTDPAGVAWETFRSMDEVPVYGDDQAKQADDACCVPMARTVSDDAKASCCVPNQATSGKQCCA
jgi:catechol 2,3-dioxygenase-like lactoylglutathione lyase family enzyme